MRTLVTGSAGHLGEGLVRTLRDRGEEVVGLDLLASPFTTHVGSVADADFVARCMQGVDRVIHTATLHKPHVATHSRAAFVETNVAGTLCVLEAALEHGVESVVFSSTTSTHGAALRPADGEPAVWVTEETPCTPKNIYGTTKRAAEDLCELFFRKDGLPCVVLRVGRFFPEEDDDPGRRARYDDLNLKVNELLHRRLDLEDAVEAHLLSADRAATIGFDRYLLSATTPFRWEDRAALRTDAPSVIARTHPEAEAIYAARGFRLPADIGRVYVNDRAREALGWQPRFDFGRALRALDAGEDVFSPLARQVGAKGYHAERFEDGPYPIESGS